MIKDMWLSAEGMNSRIHQQEIIANNLANVNTVGFKRDKVFHDVLTDATVSSGVDIRETTVFDQGSVRETENPLDFALMGEGFFTVQTEEGIRYTRNGHFKVDPDGMLVTEDGGTVMGETGPIDAKGTLAVNEKGDVYQNGALVDKLRIVTFGRPFPLKKAGNSMFSLQDERIAEIPVENPNVQQGIVEESNVNPIEEMVNMMTLYRYFEADQKALRTQDDLLGKAANEIGKV